MSGTVSIGSITCTSIESNSTLSITSSSGGIQLGNYTFPSGNPVDGDVLVTDGNGNLSFSAANQRSEVSGTTYSVLPGDDIVAITAQVDVVLTLPVPASKTVGDIMYVVKEVDGLNTVTINPNGSELISGQSSYSFSQAFGATKLYTNGTNWFLLF